MNLDLQSYFLGLITLTLFFLAFSILFRKEKIQSGISFTISMITGGVWTLSSVINRSTQDIDIALFSTRVSYLAALLTILCLLIFSETYPKIRKGSKTRIYVFLIAVWGISIILMFTDLIIKSAVLKTEFTNEGAIFGDYFGLYALVALAIVFRMFLNFTYSLKHNRGVLRDQVRYILVGGLFTSVIGIFLGVLLPLFGIDNLAYLSPLSAIISIVFIYYSVFRYRFLDMRLLFAYSLETIILMLIAYGFFYSIVVLADNILGGVYSGEAIIWGSLFSLLFIGTMKYFSKLFRDRLIEPFFGYNGISQDLNQKLGTTLDKYEVSKIFANFLEVKFSCSKVIVLNKSSNKTDDNKYEILFDSLHCSNTGSIWRYEYVDWLVDFISKRINILITDELFISSQSNTLGNCNELYQALNKHNIQLSIPISLSSEETIGILLIGNKKSGDAYSLQEIELIVDLVKPFTFALHRAVLFNITQGFNKILEQKVKRATAKLQKKYEEERDMVGILGHELRTPLTIARNMLDLLSSRLTKMKELGVIEYEYLEQKALSIKDALTREINIVETTLATSRVDNKKAEIINEPINIKETIDFVLSALSSQAKQKGLEIIYKPTTHVPEIISDQSKVLEIVTNLVSNAIKYTHKGSVQITLKFDDLYCYVSVKDTGEGIPKEEIKKLGQKFYRVNQYLDKKHNVIRAGGTGLGLYVVKGYLKLMKGDLIITSKIGRGSTFTAKIPINSNADNNGKAEVEERTRNADTKDLFVQLGMIR